ncbi:MAG: hypothetical protein JWN96_1279, partial [Mycobacterium sp.]|nr:hypothetical protein [Mycobacterium sp.]
MNLAEFRLQAEPGDGVTAYFGKAALLALDIPASGSPFFDELLAVVQAAATPDDGGPGRSLVRQMARLITRTAAADTVPFGLLADTGDSIVVLLHGSMVMTLTPLTSTQTAGASPEVVSGSDSTTWVDRLIHEDFESLVLAGQGHAASTPVMPMAAGVSAGAAIHLVRAPIPGVAEAPAQPESQFLSISLSGADVSALIALPRLGVEATPDPAPSVVGGRLLLTDGSVVALTGGVLLGREPQNAPEVADGSLSALALPDADR